MSNTNSILNSKLCLTHNNSTDLRPAPTVCREVATLHKRINSEILVHAYIYYHIESLKTLLYCRSIRNAWNFNSFFPISIKYINTELK